MNQKLENVLQLALQTEVRTRMQTEDLNVGFDEKDQAWELIVKYHGSLRNLQELGAEIEYLIAGYALLRVPEALVETVASFEQIEYVEKPKGFYYRALDPASDSCVQQLSGRDFSLSGRGVLIAVIDSGIDYTLEEFVNADGSSRIRALWDQTLLAEEGMKAPEGFKRGVEFTKEQLDEALRAADNQERFRKVPSVDTSGHGTAVAGVAAGSSNVYRGMAYEAELLVVKLGTPGSNSFPRTTDIMRGVSWALAKAAQFGKPLVINLSFGNSYGAHDGNSLLERFLNNAAEIGRTSVCVGCGNDGTGGGHLSGKLAQSDTEARIELQIAPYERTLSIQLWHDYSDSFQLRIISPGGRDAMAEFTVERGKYTILLEQTEILVFFGEPTPYSAAGEIFLDMIPFGGDYLNEGIWTFVLIRKGTGTGSYSCYLPVYSVRNAGTVFLQSTPEVTMTIPATAANVISVGAYDSRYDSYADFSGRGYVFNKENASLAALGISKPDLVAPGLNVPVVLPGGIPGRGEYAALNGTSFAAPIVSGAAALLMEWGIVQGNDSFLYGDKLKAYLRKGALPIRGEEVYPNAKAGWGKLCVENSLPL